MRPKRTVRKPTRWTAEEWRRIEEAARAHNVPPLRFVRESALGAAHPGYPASRSAPRPRRRPADQLAGEIGRVLNNLGQLNKLAEDEKHAHAIRLLSQAIRLTEEALPAVPERGEEAASLVRQLVEAGRGLNEVTHRANRVGELPSYAELYEAVARAYAVVRSIRRLRR